MAIDLLDNDAIAPPRLLSRGEALISHPVLSQDGGLIVVASTERTGDQHSSLIAFDAITGERIAELWDGPDSSLQPVLFSPIPADEQLLATTTRSGFTRPLLWHPRTGARQDLVLLDLEGDVLPYDWSPDGRRLLLCHVHQAVQRLVVYDREMGGEALLQHPSGSIGTALERGAFFDQPVKSGRSGKTRRIQHRSLRWRTLRDTGSARSLPPIRFPRHSPGARSPFSPRMGRRSRDGSPFLQEEVPSPTILDTHGGPEDVQTEVFSPMAQSWLDHGFAFLSINYRGSTTFGRAFQEQIWAISAPGKWRTRSPPGSG